MFQTFRTLIHEGTFVPIKDLVPWKLLSPKRFHISPQRHEAVEVVEEEAEVEE